GLLGSIWVAVKTRANRVLLHDIFYAIPSCCRTWPQSRPGGGQNLMRDFLPFLLKGFVLSAWALSTATPCRSQSTNPDSGIRFTDITKAAGIEFTHFKGNQGTSIN